MKTKLHFRKAMIAGLFALTALSFHANAQCQAGFTYNVNGSTAAFTNISTGGSTPTVFTWNFGDGSSGTNYNTPVNHNYLYNGNYMVCLTMYDSLNQGCQSAFCDTVVITNGSNPPCQVYVGGDSIITSGNSTTLFASFYNGNINCTSASFTWSTGVTSDSIVVAPSVTTTYTVVGYCANAACSATAVITVYVYPACNLQAGFTFNSANDPQVTFTNTSTGGSTAGAYYSWNFGDGNYSPQTNPTYTYQNNGFYLVCLTVYDSLSNCSDTYCDTITISNGTVQPCAAQFYSYPDSNNTFPGTMQFYDYSTGGATSWYWTFGDGNTSTLQHPTHQYAQSGSYQVCLTITTATGACTSCSTINVSTSPVPCGVTMYLVPDSANPASLTWYAYTYVTGVAPFTYAWDFGDGNTSTQQYPTHTYAQAGNYMICLTITDATGCSSSTCDSTYKLMQSGSMLQLVAVNTTGIEENSISGISVFPNPANDVIEISFPEWEKGTLAITDMTGREVHKQNMNANNTKVNVADVPAGCYTLSIKTETKTGHSRIMIVR